MTIAEFLALVWPSEGNFCVQAFRGNATKLYFFDTHEDAAERVQDLIDNHYDVYFAVATFKTKENRKYHNADRLKVFMLDLDCNFENKDRSFKDKAVALTALSDFCDATGLASPTLIVDSGNGVHVYWVLDSDLPRDTWKVAANRFKALCREHNFDVDPSVPADGARLMRVLGSSNHKTQPPVPTALLYHGDTITFEEFRNQIGAVAALPEAPDYIPDTPSPLMERYKESTRKKFSVLTEKIAAGIGCPQMERIISDQSNTSYDAWRSGLSIARNCEDWETAIHDISKDHPRYDHDLTITKAEDTFDKPHRCSTFDSHTPKICDKCPHKEKITSPIELCTEFIEALDNVVVEIEDGESVSYVIPELPHRYKRLATGGIYYAGKDGEDTLIYEHDIYLTKRMYDHNRGDLVMAKLHLPRERPREFIIPLSTLMAQDKLRDLLAANGVLGTKKQIEAVMMYLIRFAKHHQLFMDLEVLRMQFGWTDDNESFVLGSTEYTKNGSRYSPPAESTEDVAKAIRQKGDLSEWSKVANIYGRRDAEPFAFGLFVGFGAMLMKFTNYKGAMVNLLHPDSGTGKTTILRVINSIVGHPDELLCKESDTMAYKFHMLGLMRNIAVTYDELTNTLPEPLSNLIYGVSHGKGANRMQSQVNMARKNDTTWSTIAIGSSNASLAQKLSSIKAAANGEIMRLLEYRVDRNTNLTKQEAYEIFEGKLYQNYGVAGPVFVDWLVNNLPQAIQLADGLQVKLDNDAKLQTRERFWSAVIARGMAGGTIANGLGIIDIPVNPVYEWALDSLIPDLRGDLKENSADYSDVLGEFMNKYMPNVLIVNDESDSRSGGNFLPLLLPRGELLIRIEPDTKMVFVSSKAFKKFCNENQIVCKDLLKQLGNSKVFLGEVRKRMSKGTQVTTPAVYAYQFSFADQDIFGAESFTERLDDLRRRD